MLDTFRNLIGNQFEAALCTLDRCIDACPETSWDAPIGNLAFCQVAFHTLFYADYYLGPNDESFREQPFHRDNQQIFRDYEEFEDRSPVLRYDRRSVRDYLEHVRTKARDVIAAETVESLTGPSGFARRTFSRAELHVYNIRHLQHHCAQLSLRLRLACDQEIPWIGSGWRDR